MVYYRNRFVTQYITYLNIREALSGTLSPLSSDVLCYKPIPIMYRTSLLQNSLKVISYNGVHKIVLKVLSQNSKTLDQELSRQFYEHHYNCFPVKTTF